MEPDAAAEWVLKRACRPCRKNGFYEHKACTEAKVIHDMLKSAVKITVATKNGGQITGWLIPE